MVLFGFVFLAAVVAAILYFTAPPSWSTRNIRIALVAGLALAALNITGARAEELIEVVGDANGCTTTFAQIYDIDGTPISTVTLVCPRLPVQVASTDQSTDQK